MGTHRRGKLLFICGKMAAGKSTLSKELAAREDAVHLAQDGLLGALYPGEFVDLAAFLKYSTRLQSVLTPHIVALLTKGVSVVLDFPANTRRQRAWFRQLIEMSGSDHELHFIVASDELCKRQLKQRNQGRRARNGQRKLTSKKSWCTSIPLQSMKASMSSGMSVTHDRARPGPVTRRSVSALGPPRPSGLITLDVNHTRERSAITPHAAFDVAGAGNVAGLTLCRRASPRPYRRGIAVIRYEEAFVSVGIGGNSWY